MIAQICDHVAHGVHIGNCVDRLFVLSCCKISKPGRSGKPNTNITHTYNTVPSNSYADSNKTAETAKENFPEVEPLDEILNAPSIGSLNWNPESSDIRIINTSANDDIVSEQQSNQQKVPVNEQIMKDYLTLLLAYYEHLYRLQLNTAENKNCTKSHNNTDIPIQKTSSENSANGPTFNHHASINFRPYVINNHAQPSPTQGINADTSQSETETISSWLKNYLKNNFKTNINAKPITPLIPQKLNNESSALSSTISSSNSTNNETESLLKVNISDTSYSLLNENTLPSNSKSPSNISLNSTKLSDINFSVSTTKPISFKPVSSPSDTTLLPSDVTTSSAVYVSTNISSKSSLDASTSNSINATESLYEASLSNTLYLSENETTLSDITHSFEETFNLERIASLIKNIIKYYYKHKMNIKELNKHMPHQLNNESSMPSSISSSSNSINNDSDLLYKVNVSAISYSTLNEGTKLPTSSVNTSSVSQNSTKFTDIYLSVPATEPTLFETVNNPSQTALPQDEVTTQTAVYVSKNTSFPSLGVFLSSSNNTIKPLYDAKISNTLYSSVKGTSYSNTTPQYEENLKLKNITSFLRHAVKTYYKNYMKATPVTSPNRDKVNDESNVTSSTDNTPTHSITNESLNKLNISATSYSLIDEDTSSTETSTSYSNVLFNSTNLSDPYFWESSSKPVSSPSSTTLLQSDVTTPSAVYVSINISAPSWDEKLNDDNSVPSSPFNSINNEYDSFNQANISTTSYSLLNGDTPSPDISTITSNVLFNSTYLPDVYFYGSSSETENSPSETSLLQTDIIAPSPVYVSTNISETSGNDKFDDDSSVLSSTVSPNSINNEYESLNKVNISTTSYSLSEDTSSTDISTKTSNVSFNSTNLSDILFLGSSAKPASSEPVSIPTDTTMHQSNVTAPSPVYVSTNISVPSWEDKFINDSSVPSSTVSPSNSITNEDDSQYKVNISATPYSLLNEDTFSSDTSFSTSNVLFSSTNVSDIYYWGSSSKPTSSQPVSSPPDTTLLQSGVTTPSPVYVSTNKSVPSWNVELSNDSSVPPSNVSPSMSMNNEYDSLNKVNISAMSYSLLNIDTSSPHTSPSTSNLLFNSTNLSDLYFWGSSSKPTSFESVSSLSDSTLLQSDVTAPSPVYVSTNISAPSWDDKFIDDSIVPSSTLSPSNSISNEYDSQNKITISDTSQSFLNEDTSSPDTSSSISNVLFNSTNLSDLYFWGSSSKPTASSISPPDTTLLQSDLSTPSPVYVSTDISEPSWDVKLKNDSSLSSSTASHSIKNESDSLNKVNISATSYSLLNKDTTFPDNLESISVDSTNLLEPPSVVSPTKASIFEAVHSFSETKPTVVEPNSPSTLYVFKDSNMPSFNLTQLLKYFVLKSSWKLSILEPVSNLSDTPPLPEGIIAPVLNYVIYGNNKLSENNSSSISINNATDILLESSISNTLHSLRNETKSYDNLDSASNLSLNIDKHLDPDILISSSKPTVSEPVSSIINTAPLPNKSFTPYVILVLMLSGGLSSTSSVSYYNSIRPDATVSHSPSLHDGIN